MLVNVIKKRPMKLTNEEKEAEALLQIEEMVESIRKLLQKAVKQNLRSGGMPEAYLEEGNYLLAKSAMYCLSKGNPYAPRDKTKTKKEFENIYKLTPSL